MIQYLITVFINLIIGGVAISKRHLNGAVALFFTSICLASWIFELFLLTVVVDAKVLSVLFHLFRTGMFFIPSALALFTWRLINKPGRLFLYLVLVPGFVSAAVLSILNNTFFPTEIRPTNLGYLPVIDEIYLCFIGNFIWCMAASLVFSIYHYIHAKNREKQKIRWLLIAMLAAFCAGAISLYLFQFDTYLSKLSGPATDILFVSLLLYATVQHNLMDLRLAVSLWTSRLLLLSLFCWAYFYLTSSLDLSFDSFGGTVTLMLFFVLVLELYPRLLNWIIPGSKKLFGVEAFNFEQTTAEARLRLSKAITLEEMESVLDNLTRRAMSTTGYNLFLLSQAGVDEKTFYLTGKINPEITLKNTVLPSSDKFSGSEIFLADEVCAELAALMSSYSSESLILLREESKVLGFLLVGKPKFRGFYRYDDWRLMEWLSAELPQNIDRILAVKNFEEELKEAKKRLSLINLMNHYHHDIKAPLSIIDGVITHELYDKEKQRQIILEQVALGSKLITTMANLLKGKRERQVEPVLVNAIIKDAVLIFNHALAESEIDVDDDAVILGDADDLKILFINIIKNASEAVRAQKKVSIKVKSWRDNKTLRVSISDNGMGMPDEQLRELWSSGRTTKSTGSGVGLQAIKRIAEEHRATIDVASRLGQGTDITLVFPLSA